MMRLSKNKGRVVGRTAEEQQKISFGDGAMSFYQKHLDEARKQVVADPMNPDVWVALRKALTYNRRPEELSVAERAEASTYDRLEQTLRNTISPNATTSLQHLDLSAIGLIRLPLEICRLTSLTSLNLSNNHLTSLPPEILQLTQLTSLNLSNNHLTSLPPEILQLTQLTSLDLHNNHLVSLPSEIGQLVTLAELDLGGTQLTSLPAEFGRLNHLSSIALGNNSLTNLPLELCGLTTLSRLDLGGNHLTSLPPEIGQLTKLSFLVLGDNRLASLPPEIGQLTTLAELDLSANRLSDLPAEMINLIHLQKLYLKDNPLPLPLEILERAGDPHAIIHYHQQYLAQPRKVLNEAKVLLVGQGGVGKSSLIRRLIDNSFNPAESKTEGIDIQRWQLPLVEDNICLNVWDFGGQEIMHATHQFFLTERSLYILVIDNRIEEEESRLEYWLKIIQSFGGDSPIIIVGNKVDQHPMVLDPRALERKYDNIRAFIETSCQTGAGLVELETAIRHEIERLPHIRDQLIATWFEVKATLEQMDEDYLPYDKYVELCVSKGIHDEISQRTLLGFLHDLGIVLNFQDDPRLEDTNILNPEWVTRGVYNILNADILAQSYGVLEFSMLSQILDSRRYPRSKQMFIIDMMRKFELCYDFEGQPDQFLIPDLLPKGEPETGDWRDALAFQYRYRVLPSSIISRFIVRMNKIIARNQVWRNGVVLERNECDALVRADREERLIHIRISGRVQERRWLLEAIRIQLEAIHQTIPGLGVQAEVPLPQNPSVAVSYEHLLKLEKLGQITFLPQGHDSLVNVRQLLEGIQPNKSAEEKAGIPPEVHQSLCEVLLRSPFLDDDKSLNHLFVDQRIAAWQGYVPAASTAQSRVQAVIASLHNQADKLNRGALGLFLEVISDKASMDTALKRDLDRLTQEVRALGY